MVRTRIPGDVVVHGIRECERGGTLREILPIARVVGGTWYPCGLVVAWRISQRVVGIMTRVHGAHGRTNDAGGSVDRVWWRRSVVFAGTIVRVGPLGVHEFPEHPIALLCLLLEPLVLITKLGGLILGGTTGILQLDDDGLEVGD